MMAEKMYSAILTNVAAEWSIDSATGKVTAGKMTMSAGEISLCEIKMLYDNGYFQSGRVDITNSEGAVIAQYHIIDEYLPQVIWFYINDINLDQQKMLSKCRQIAYKYDDRRKGTQVDICCAVNTAAILFLISLRGDEIIMKE